MKPETLHLNASIAPKKQEKVDIYLFDVLDHPHRAHRPEREPYTWYQPIAHVRSLGSRVSRVQGPVSRVGCSIRV
eukprot:3067544-Rhodomonas_salina.1